LGLSQLFIYPRFCELACKNSKKKHMPEEEIMDTPVVAEGEVAEGEEEKEEEEEGEATAM
jgi:hypothetical protein